MKVLVLGNGGREHAIAAQFAKSKTLSGLFCLPGNAGTATIATNLADIDPCNPSAVLDAVRKNVIDLVFIGPEGPLNAGVADVLREYGIPTIGPDKKSALLEGSKAFSKAFMVRNNIPTAEYHEFSEFSAAADYLRANKKRVVLKKSGLAAGKGVLESTDLEEQLAFAKQVLPGDKLVIEEFLQGYEVSVFAISDGRNYRLLPVCADYKKAFDGGLGPNTGGMGSICPVPWLEKSMMDRIEKEAIGPTFDAMKKEGLSFPGVLYFGFMVTAKGPHILEYNTRFGDPETQPLLSLLKSDFGELCSAIVEQKLDTVPIEFSSGAAVGVVVAAAGYPASVETGIVVDHLPQSTPHGTMLYHASTIVDNNGLVRTGSGRCFTVVGTGKDLYDARSKAYELLPQIRFEGAWSRTDIGIVQNEGSPRLQ